MKITVNIPKGVDPLAALEEVADRLGAYMPAGSSRMSLDFGVNGQGWFKVEGERE